MTTVKINLMFALAAALMAAPLVAAPAAADKDKAAAAKDEAAAEAGPTPEQLKARKAKKPAYTKFVEAKAVAEKCGLPILVATIPDRNQYMATVKQKVLNSKPFKEFTQKNCVMLFMTLKLDGKDPKKIETRQLKEPEIKFLENFGVTKRMIDLAKQYNKPEPKFTDVSCYPAIFFVDSLAQKELFRVNLGTFNKDSGLGEWISAIVEEFRAKVNENAELTPLLNKILENPDDPKKWK